MSNQRRVKFHFDEFKKYAQFLLENKSILDELLQSYFEEIRSSNIPMMRFLEHLPANQHKKMTDNNIVSFLQHSLNDTAFEDSIVIIEQWKSNELFGVPKEEVEVTDILTVTNCRKKLYVDFLDRFTQDLSLFRSIVDELDGFHMQFQKYAFDSYVTIHQEELANENQFVTSLINNSVDGILAFDQQLKVTEFNHVLEKWHGIRKAEVVGKDILKVFSAYNDSIEGNPLVKALNGKRTFIPENPFMNREGFYEANIVPLYDHKGQIKGGLVITHDITKRKEAEEEIKETKHLLQEITDAVPNVIYVSDFTTKKVVFINKEIATLAGYTTEEVKSFSRGEMEQLVHPDDLIALEKQTKEIHNLKKGEVSDLNVRIKHKDGRWRWIKTKSKIFKYNEAGEPLQTIRVFEDVTKFIKAQQTIQQQNEELAATLEELQSALEELQAAEEQLREMNEELEHRVERRTRDLAESEKKVKRREDQLRLITDAMPVLISYLRNDKTFEFANKAYEGAFQISRKEIIGKHIREILGEKAYSNSKPLMDRALEGEFKESELLQDYGKAGKKWVKATLVPHKVKNKVVGVFSLVEDVTKFKNIQFKQEELLLELNKANKEKEKALKQLEKKNEDLERTNTDLDNFIYTASHDLRSPISNMEGLMILLKKSTFEKVEPKERQLLEMMETSVQRLRKTIGDLVEVTKVHKELEDADEEPLRFEEISREVKDDIYNLIQESNVIIKEDYKVEEVIYKRSSLRSILYNLLSNAIKYRSPDRRLKVELKTYIHNGFVVLSVKDNGLGLNPKQQQKLFTLFKRMHQHVEGTGVGLFMVKRMVENNGGIIEVKSAEGKGTEFLVFLTRIADLRK